MRVLRRNSSKPPEWRPEAGSFFGGRRPEDWMTKFFVEDGGRRIGGRNFLWRTEAGGLEDEFFCGGRRPEYWRTEFSWRAEDGGRRRDFLRIYGHPAVRIMR